MKKKLLILVIPLLILAAVFLVIPRDQYAAYENATFSAG